jgi:hypothetical protein
VLRYFHALSCRLFTHALGGLSINDFIVAARCDAALAQLASPAATGGGMSIKDAPGGGGAVRPWPAAADAQHLLLLLQK